MKIVKYKKWIYKITVQQLKLQNNIECSLISSSKDKTETQSHRYKLYKSFTKINKKILSIGLSHCNIYLRELSKTLILYVI